MRCRICGGDAGEVTVCTECDRERLQEFIRRSKRKFYIPDRAALDTAQGEP